MFSVLAASALLPFLPMESLQLIFLNLIYDLSCTAIPWDNVDEEFISVPRKWDASSVGSFMMWIGPTSSVFDWMTYIFMYLYFVRSLFPGECCTMILPVYFAGARFGTDADGLCCNVSDGMVYRIYVEPDSGHPYDPHTKPSVYSKPCICTTDADDIYRNRSADDHSIYYIWQNVGICGTADGIFCVPDSVHPALYGAGNKFEKSICASLWRIAVKGGMKDELDKSLDKIIWNNEVMGLDMGFWVSIAVVIVVVILMNVIFWNMELTEKIKG